MVSKRSIQMDYQKALNQAKTLESQAEALKKIADNKMSDSLQQISVNWYGENASMYLKKGNVLRGKIAQSSIDLKNIAGCIRRIAKKIYNADMKAKEIMKG